MASKKASKKENKDILVYFGDTDIDFNLRSRIRERCKYISESSFMKEAAEEKLNKEEAFDKLNYFDNRLNHIEQISSQQNTPQKDDDATMNNIDIDAFLDSVD